MKFPYSVKNAFSFQPYNLAKHIKGLVEVWNDALALAWSSREKKNKDIWERKNGSLDAVCLGSKSEKLFVLFYLMTFKLYCYCNFPTRPGSNTGIYF